MTSKDLAEHFGVSRRTIFRDLRALGESGVPLTYGDDGGYEILRGYQLPPLMFSGQQATTVLIGTRFMRLQSDASLRKEAEEVALKIRAVLPRRLRDYIDKLLDRTIMDPFELHKYSSEIEGLWFKVSEAVAQRRRIVMDYSAGSNARLTKRRKAEPLGMVHYEDHWNLIARDQLRGGSIRNFRLDRIRDIFVLTERFDPPPGFDLRTHVQDQGQKKDRTVIRFDKKVYQNARRRLPAIIQDERHDDTFVTVTIDFENHTYLAELLLGFGGKVEVLQPPALRATMRQLAARVVSLYDADEATE